MQAAAKSSRPADGSRSCKKDRRRPIPHVGVERSDPADQCSCGLLPALKDRDCGSMRCPVQGKHQRAAYRRVVVAYLSFADRRLSGTSDARHSMPARSAAQCRDPCYFSGIGEPVTPSMRVLATPASRWAPKRLADAPSDAVSITAARHRRSEIYLSSSRCACERLAPRARSISAEATPGCSAVNV